MGSSLLHDALHAGQLTARHGRAGRQCTLTSGSRCWITIRCQGVGNIAEPVGEIFPAVTLKEIPTGLA